MAQASLSVRRWGSQRRRRRLGSLLAHAAIIGVGLFFVVPFLWMISTALKADTDLGRQPFHWIPRDNLRVDYQGQLVPLYTRASGDRTERFGLLRSASGVGTFVNLDSPDQIFDSPLNALHEEITISLKFSNFPGALGQIPFWTYAKNTATISLLVVVGTLLSCTLAAYGFARVQWPGREIVFLLVLSTMMLPAQVTLVPLYIIFTRTLHWSNTFYPLTVPSFFANAFDIFLLRQFFKTIPLELSDAARVDGAAEWQIFTQVVLPLSTPVLATVAVMTFLYSWNDLQGPLLYLNSADMMTLSVGLLQFKSLHQVHWNLMMAASAIFAMPVIVLFFFGQKTFIQGVKLTGIKG
ncbi:MAG TPA: carbohydrate ABC transporter permease [Roseiflexaceae bacterium]|nr:carbohydrate ABC transporter permease [Roseiflexaceae bacterium]